MEWRGRADWIVTNPPWSKFLAFLEKSMRSADDVVFLATVNHWWTTARVRAVGDAGFGYRELALIDKWPKEFPKSGFQLGAMRIQRGYRGPLEIRRLEWDR